MLRVRNQIGCRDELIESCGSNGITVAVLDTGIAAHPDFDNRIIGFKDFVNNKKNYYEMKIPKVIQFEKVSPRQKARNKGF